LKHLFRSVALAFHGYLAILVRTFAEDRNRRPAWFYRILNETPTVLMALIVVFVVFKPL
jgi:putative membrane protein